jgi:hypothetical protein
MKFKKDFDILMSYMKNRLQEVFQTQYNEECSLQEIITRFF